MGKITPEERRTMLFDHNVWIAEQILAEARKVESGHYLHDIRSDTHRLEVVIKKANKNKYVKVGAEEMFTEMIRVRARLAASLYMQEKEIWA